MGASISVIPVSSENLERLLPLILAYQKFYGISGSTIKNRSYFTELLSTPEKGLQFAAVEDVRYAGFATLYFVPSSVQARQICLLNDLFTSPPFRGRGVARALIQHARKVAAQKGYPAIEWMTQKGNASAQRLYDSYKGTKTEWYFYSLPHE